MRRSHIISCGLILFTVFALLLTACSSGPQVMDGYIAIPGSGNPDHIAENYDIFDFELSEDEMDRIRGIDEQSRYEYW